MNGVNGNIVGANPALVFGPLADNGGPTLPGAAKLLTHTLLIGSPAIDAGDPSAGAGNIPLFDQRGSGFTRVIGNALDIGAFERQTPELVGDYNRNDAVDAADYVLWRKTFGATGAPFRGADGNGNGDVGQADYGVWRAHFGQSLPAAGTAESNAATQQRAAATSTEVAPSIASNAANVPTTPDKGGVAPASITKPAVGSPFVSIADTEDSPRVRTRHGATTSSGRTIAILNDDALLAWLSSAHLKELPLPEHTAASPHSNDDSSQVDDAEPNSVDVVFTVLANSRLSDL